MWTLSSVFIGREKWHKYGGCGVCFSVRLTTAKPQPWLVTHIRGFSAACVSLQGDAGVTESAWWGDVYLRFDIFCAGMFWLAGCLHVCGHASHMNGCMFRPLTWPNEGLEYLRECGWQRDAAVCVGLQSQVCVNLMCVWGPAVEFRRVGVCGQLWWNVGSPPLCGHGQTGLLRNHCDCSWRPATVKGKEEGEKAPRGQVTVSFISHGGCSEENIQSSELHYSISTSFHSISYVWGIFA